MARRCAAAGVCTRPAVTVLVNNCGATDLCERHDHLARAMSLQKRPGEAPLVIVEDVVVGEGRP